MWPAVPNDIKSLSAEEAKALAKAIRLQAVKVLREGVDADGRTELDAQMAIREALLAHAADQERAAELEDDSKAKDEPAPAEPETLPPVQEQPEVQPGVKGSEIVEPTEGGGLDLDLQTADTTGRATPVLSTSFGASSATAAAVRPDIRPVVLRTAPEYLIATSGVQGKQPGDAFESWAEMSLAATERGKVLNPATAERHEIARIRGNYPADRRLTDDVMLNAVKFEQDELMAAFCPPATPYYNLACANTMRRPVFASLPGFQAPRGSVSIMSSPSLSDITTGFGQWTSADDADADAVKDACQTITCGTPTTYEMYGVYRCLTVKNMMAMTYPELVEAYLNRLGAAWARMAEELMLNAMATGTTAISAPTLGYGGAVTITSTILNYLALYQETQRWDVGNMEAWIPRWVLWAMKMDIVRRRTTNSTTAAGLNVPSDSEIEGLFSKVGVNVHWFLDRPTWAVAIPALSTGGTLNRVPASVQILLAPPGKFAAIDRGELAIGVTGNNIYRDNESNRRNQFTFFFENFEGVVNTTSCPAHVLSIPTCWNGVQIDDIVINCQGGDELGYQS